MKLSFSENLSRVFAERMLYGNILLYCAVFIFVLKLSWIAVSINLPQNIFFADITKTSLVGFVNQSREQAGLAPLFENEKLNQAAHLKAENMAENQYFSHTSPTGISPWHWFSVAGYNYKYAGENLAIGFYESEEVYNAWLASPSHKSNLLNANYTEIGTAVLHGFDENNAVIVVQLFGAPAQKQISANNSAIATKESPESPESRAENLPPANGSDNTVQDDTMQTEIESKSGIVESARDSGVSSFILYNRAKVIQDIIFGCSLLIIGVLFSAILIGRPGFNKNLVFRSLVILVFVLASALLDAKTITQLIPHRILI